MKSNVNLSLGSKVLIGVGFVLLLALFWGVSVYNNLISLNNDVENKWGDVETQYQRRVDLIPNLVNTVKGYAKHESGLFEEVARLRSQWQSASSVNAKMDVARGIDGALGRLIAVAETYPQLRASDNFMSLQDELAGTENRISVARVRYNDAVRIFNNGVMKVPNNLIAGFFGFVQKQSFKADVGAEKAPEVKF